MAYLLSILFIFNTSWALWDASLAPINSTSNSIVLLKNKDIICTSSLVEDRWILTAGHCLDMEMKPYVTHPKTRKKLALQILNKIVHPQFYFSRIQDSTLFKSGSWSHNPESSMHDVALIELTNESTLILKQNNIYGFSKSQIQYDALLPNEFEVQVYGLGLFNEKGQNQALKTKKFWLQNLTNSFYFTDDIGIRGGDSGGPLIYDGLVVGLNSAIRWNLDDRKITSNEFTNLSMQENQNFIQSALTDMRAENQKFCLKLSSHIENLYTTSRKNFKNYGHFLLEEPVARACHVSQNVCQTECPKL